MAHINFHTPEKTVTVEGGEHGYMRDLVLRINLAILRPGENWGQERLTPFLRGIDRFAGLRGPRWVQAFVGWLEYPQPDRAFDVDGTTIGTADLKINTLLALGSPAMALIAKLAATHEDWAFVDATDAEWFGEILEQTIAARLLRPNCGWEDVAALARAVAGGLAGPIVTTYSPIGEFPSPYLGVTEWPVTAEYLADWRGQSPEEKWRRSEIAMRSRPVSRQFAPATLSQRYSSGLSAFDVQAAWDAGTEND